MLLAAVCALKADATSTVMLSLAFQHVSDSTCMHRCAQLCTMNGASLTHSNLILWKMALPHPLIPPPFWGADTCFVHLLCTEIRIYYQYNFSPR